jgi:hypothetical protein
MTLSKHAEQRQMWPHGKQTRLVTLRQTQHFGSALSAPETTIAAAASDGVRQSGQRTRAPLEHAAPGPAFKAN